MPRVTDAEVKEILNTTIDTTAFITAANLLVTDMLGSSSLSADRLKEIERWLSAHFACMWDTREASVKIGSVEAVFEGKSGMNLDFTRYGQQVKLLDSTGTLAALSMKRGRVTVASRDENFDNSVSQEDI